MKRYAMSLAMMAMCGLPTWAWAQAATQPAAPAASPVATAKAPAPASAPAATQPTGAGATCPVSGATTRPTGSSGMSGMSPAMREMFNLGAAMPSLAATQPGATKATLSIQAVQGTKGGPKISGDKVLIEMYSGPGEPATREAKLDEHGVLVIEDLPLAKAFQPRVTVYHGEASYQAVGDPVTPASPNQTIKVTVYETTDQRPALEIKMRHVLVNPDGAGLRVTEMMALDNPADRTWTGVKGPDGKGRTMAMAIGAQARDVEMGGSFHSCCVSVVDGQVVSTAPIVPGLSQFSISYTLAAMDGAASVPIDTPAPVANMMVFVPEDPTIRAEVQGPLKRGEVYNVREKPMRAFMGRSIPAGQKIVLTVSGLALPVAAGGSSAMPKILGGVGGGLLLVLCLVMFLRKPRRKEDGKDAEKIANAKGAG